MELAIQVHRLNVTAQNGSTEVKILRDLNLVVPKGSIFGLLGPSGCGKTTLLKCLIGSVVPSKGIVRVFGRDPSEMSNKSLVGFMPQELALYDELTVKETLTYFGRLYCIDEYKLEQSIDTLTKFLGLIEQRKQHVSTLSGGQKRRLSLATALIHEPKLTILDEPTVGVDPVLSHSIWKHLITLSQNGMTIIITTHYINEAQDANYVGFMRDGHILTQGPLKKFQDKTKSLEKVFLEICIRNERSKSLTNGLLPPATPTTPEIVSICKGQGEEFGLSVKKKCSFSSFFTIILALLWKSWVRMKRIRQAALFMLVVPTSQIILFCTCMGNDPIHIKLAIVNEEKTPFFSSMFLEKIPTFTVHQKNFKDLPSAYESVKRAESWGVLHIHKDFTLNVQRRLSLGPGVNNSIIQSTVIKVYPDLTNKQVSETMMVILQESMIKFYIDLVRTLGLNTVHSRFPIELAQPVYIRDSYPGGFLQFIVPGIIATICFSTIASVTALAIVIEQAQGLIERTLYTGATIRQVLLATAIVHIIIVMIQIALVVPITFFFFQIQSHGPIYLICALLLLQGIVGVTFGLFIFAFCQTETTTIAFLLGTLFPNLILSGIIWPVDAIPVWFRWIAYLQPTTVAITSLRNIMLRGWGIEQPGVYNGFLTSIGFAILFFAVANSRIKGHR